MLLVDGHILCCAVDLGGGGHDEPLHTLVERRLAHVERPLHICVNVALRRHIAVRYGNQRGEVKHCVHPFGDMPAEGGIAHIAAHHFQILVVIAFEPSPVVE